jgi:hypothetical protein
VFCWYCGTKLPGAAAFCYRCGQSQAPDADYDAEATPLAPGGWTWKQAAPTNEPAPEAEAETLLPASQPPGVPTVLVEVPKSRHQLPLRPGQAEVAGTEPASASPAPSRLPGILALGCGLAVVAGSFGPWVVAYHLLREPVRLDGADWDGRVTLWCGLAAVFCLILLLTSPRRGVLGVLAAGAFLLAALIGIADWADANERLGTLRRIEGTSPLRWEIGWGLQAVTFGGVGGTILALAQALQARRLNG